MISIATKGIEDIIVGYDAEIIDHWQMVEKGLVTYNSTLTDAKEKNYLNHLLALGKEIITANTKRLNDLKKEFGKIISASDMKSKKRKVFRNTLIELMGYANLRSTFYPKYFFKVGIKTCVYCNALLTVVVERAMVLGKSKGYQAKFQADHYLPKKEYPCFSISIFNLYPVCANCNIVKGVKKVSFNLYSDVNKHHQSPFSFRLSNGCKAKFLLSRNLDDIVIEFDEPIPPKGHEKFDDLFSIKGTYATQRDVAADLILKAEAYPLSYRNTLLTSLPKIFQNKSVVNRLITGNYAEESDIHKRPLAKFTLDIAYQIGLLKKDP
ncbi:hypothetical protein IM793_23045 [Pedobacter sp. MR2016-19]|uniref:hypothetical protein n=1 Tax=Pedobacter sp. MR2016-19 TaxID=2780089 RepID=UPI0018736851|nr:hypothetical protein [Pedobacter sp. MR2016-19]MBE5322051.1 hypothetical protein [Pedobacter sp. MR2016-19]